MKILHVSAFFGWLAFVSVAGAQNPPRIVTPPTVRPQLQIAPAPLMPSYQVVRGKVPDELANRLGIFLKTTGKLGLGDGSVRFLSPKFLSLPSKAVEDATPNEEKKPTRAIALQLDQLSEVKPLDPDRAKELVLQALKGAQLDVPGATPTVGHTTLRSS